MENNPILKHPWNYSAGELEKLMFKPLRFHVGEIKSDEVKEIVEGVIVKIILASNPPHLPADIVVELVDNSTIRYCILEVKGFSYPKN
ncbi:hypothetical protein [Algoriphagus boritolerans]|uniref:Uncharacterized protein n=2 Tax=Algoriphagus TaxID=246875 RepID=A0A1H5XUS2_9BACT|nr:hypothetical protein [Algoriphagus boritolerans]SEG15481.1 hypothetical protein SAMN03080598_02691 [Algoriphagus boritolerans DSM 17298 = JCM 18970]